MDILHCFEIYQKQINNIEKHNYFGRPPQILRQFRRQYRGFNKTEIETLKEFLRDNDKKWFVANLLDSLDTFPVELLEPMLTAAVDEPDASFNNEFIAPCRRVFDYVEIQKILLEIFKQGNTEKKIGVLKALYWARPTVYAQTLQEENKIYIRKGHETFFWDNDLRSFNEDFEADEELFNLEAPRQEEAYCKQVSTIIEAFYKTADINLKYQIGLRLPNQVEGFPSGLQEMGAKFLKNKKQQGIPTNISELNKVQNVKNPFLRRILLSTKKIFNKKRGITLKQR